MSRRLVPVLSVARGSIWPRLCRLGPAVIGATLLSTALYIGGGPPAVHAAGGFSCGPNAITYSVSATDDRLGSGFRCVEPSTPAGSFIWYGESSWNGQNFRTLGYARGTSAGGWTGYAADLVGDASASGASFPGTLAFSQSSSSGQERLDVTGDWLETWARVGDGQNVQYPPLAPLQACGHSTGIASFHAYAGSASGPLQGLRCVLALGEGLPVVWYGDGSNDTHIGSFDPSTSVGQAGDLCFPTFGSVCNRTEPGALFFKPSQATGKTLYYVTGAWNEVWVADGQAASGSGAGSGGADSGAVPTSVVPLGTTANLSDGWQLRVDGLQRNATAIVLAANSLNQPPPAGRQYVLVNVTVTFTGPGSDSFDDSYRLRLLSTSGNIYKGVGDASCPPFPKEVPGANVPAGTTEMGNSCWAIPTAEVGGLVLVDAPDPDPATWTYFELPVS